MLKRWNTLVEDAPEALALIENGQHLTRYTLNELALEREHELQEYRLKRVGILLRRNNGIKWLADFIAYRRAGAVIIPVDAATTPEECHKLAYSLRCFAVQDENFHQLSDNPRRWKSNVALVKLTSGTSGTPTPIPFTESEITADADNIMATMGITAQDLNFALLPFAHSYALGNLILPLLASGVPLAVGSSPLPRIVAEEITKTCATVFPSVPAIFEGLARTDDLSLGKLRLCISAAAPLSPKLAQKFEQTFGLRIHNFYGASECGGIAYDRTGTSSLTGDSVGQAMEGVELTSSSDGRLKVRSGAVSSYGRSIVSDRYATVTLNDKVSFQAKGIVIHGRVDRTIKCAGRRIDLAKLEQQASQIAGVNRAAAIHDDQLDRIHVFFEGQAATASVLENIQRQFAPVRGRLRIRELDRLPVTLRGKIDYKKMKQTLQTNDKDTAY